MWGVPGEYLYCIPCVSGEDAGFKKMVSCSLMTSVLHTYREKKLSKELLAVAFLLGILSFSGYAAHTTPRQQPAVQTELLITVYQKPARQVVLYKTLRAIAVYTICYDGPGRYYAPALLSFNRCMRVKLAVLSRQWHCFNISDRFMPLKTIPHSSGEDFLSAVTG